MDNNHDADGSSTGPTKVSPPCVHLFDKLTPTTAQCQRCQFIIPIVPDEDAPDAGRGSAP
jgi:hypothetical protein